MRILDCTLRDGGYYTNWDFDESVVTRYFEGVTHLPIDTVEAGYCSQPRDGYHGQYYYLGRSRLSEIRDGLRDDQQLAVMINAKDHDPVALKELLAPLADVLDLVRIAADPDKLAPALQLGSVIADLGLKVGLNVMYLSRYIDDIEPVVARATSSGVLSTLALVDSYGSCRPDPVTKAFGAAAAIAPDVELGFHGHDNLELAFANTLAAVAGGATVIDSTFTGMGRGAGNTKTELALIHQAATAETPLDYEALNSITSEFSSLRDHYGWGTNLAYMISGASDLPQRDVMDWMGKNRYSVISVLRALQGVRDGGLDHTDLPDLATPPAGVDELIIVGGGPSVRAHLNAITEYIALSGATVVHANLRNLEARMAVDGEQLICIAGDGAMRLPPSEHLANSTIVVPTPPRLPGATPHTRVRGVVQVESFTLDGEDERLGPVSDIGPLALALGAAIHLRARRVSLVGFDGYANASRAQRQLASETQVLIDRFRRRPSSAPVSSLTPTEYDIPTDSIYSRLITLNSTR